MIINLLIQNKLEEATKILHEKLNILIEKRLNEAKEYIAADLYESAINVVKMGKVHRIRRRIRRDAQGRIFIQRNTNRSAVKGYRVVGKSIRRISAVQKFRRSQQLKRDWRTFRRARLSRSLLRRKMSMRRRNSLGLR